MGSKLEIIAKRQKNEEAARVRILKVVSVFSVNRLLGSPPVSEEEGVPGCVYGAWCRFKVASVGEMGERTDGGSYET